MSTKPKKRRGRPAAPLSKDQDVNERRERNRLIQQSSRSRKKASRLAHDAEIDRLHNVISDLSDIFINFNERVFDSDVVNDSIVTTQLTELTAQFVEKAQEADGAAQRQLPETVEAASLPVTPPSSITTSITNGSGKVSAFLDSSDPHNQHSRQIFGNGATWSPRLNYGALFIESTDTTAGKARNPVLDIDAGQDSFAARLFFACLQFSYNEVSRMMGPFPAPPSTLFRFTVTCEPVESTMQRTTRAMDRLTNGPQNIEAKIAVCLDHDCEVLAIQLRENILRMGYDPDDYLDVYGVEDYLHTNWDMQTSANTIKQKTTYTSGNSSSRSSNTLLKDSQDLIAAIAQATTCFGVGPKFPKPWIDRSMHKFLSSIPVY